MADAYGNLISDGASTYTYDAAMRLKQVMIWGDTTTYAYNGDGDRIAQTINGVQTSYIIDTATPLTMVLAETTGGQTITYWHGLDVIAQLDGSQTEYFGYDGLGSVRQLSDATTVQLAQTFDPYGNGYSKSGTTTSVLGFTGEQTDSNGFVFLRARFYNPASGRFLNTDPSRQERNPYQYGFGNPILNIDPTGRFHCVPDLSTAEGIKCTLEEINEFAPYVTGSILPAFYADGTKSGMILIGQQTATATGMSLSAFLSACVAVILPGVVLCGDTPLGCQRTIPERLPEPEPHPQPRTQPQPDPVRLPPPTIPRTPTPSSCDPGAFTNWWFTLPEVAGSIQPNEGWYQYEQRVARSNGAYGNAAREVVTGPINADGIEPGGCYFVEAKYPNPEITQFRNDNPPPWIEGGIVREFQRYKNAIMTSNGIPNAQPAGLIVRTSLDSSQAFFERLLMEVGFTLGVNGFVQVQP